MSIQIEILNRKPKTLNAQGEEIVDLTAASIRYVNENIRTITLCQVAEDMRMRPDIISRLYYGSENYIGHILKINAISNPFSIDGGDILIIPELVDMERSMVNNIEEITDKSVRDQYIDENKKRENDSSREELDKKLEEIRKKGLSDSLSRTNLPPNISEEGDSEFKIRGGKIIFGGDVTKGKSQCSDPVAVAELKSRMIKNRLK